MAEMKTTGDGVDQTGSGGMLGRWKVGSLRAVGNGVVKGSSAFIKTWAAFTLLIQGGSMVAQSYQESARAAVIGTMSGELDWLQGEGLAPKARVGVAPLNRAGHAFGSQTEAALVDDRMWGGWSVVGQLAKALPEMKWAGWSPSEARYVISAPARDLENFEPMEMADGRWESKLESVLPSVLRHEAGHALAHENNWGPGRPAAWSEASGRVAARIVKSQMERASSSSLAQEPWRGDWRGKWLAGIWNESLADAFSCVSAAKKGESRSCALSRHSRRVFPTGPRDVSSITAAGNDHAVEMASFMVAQLDEDALAKLDPKQVGELSKSIANESLAWALARQGKSIGFFAGAGLDWWMSAADSAGVDLIPAKKAWRDLTEASLEEKPLAAVGPFEWNIGGIAFKAEGLGQGMPSDWRYDGMAGQVFFEDYMDSSAKSNARVLIQSDGNLKFAPFGSSDEESVELDDRALLAAVDIHLGLAKKCGCSVEAEAARLGKMFMATRMGVDNIEMLGRRAKALGMKQASPTKRGM